METERNYVIRIMTALLFTLKLKISTKILLMIMKVFSGAKTWTYLMDDYSEKKIVIGTKIRVIKRRIILENYADYSFNDKIILNSQ